MHKDSYKIALVKTGCYTQDPACWLLLRVFHPSSVRNYIQDHKGRTGRLVECSSFIKSHSLNLKFSTNRHELISLFVRGRTHVYFRIVFPELFHNSSRCYQPTTMAQLYPESSNISLLQLSDITHNLNRKY